MQVGNVREVEVTCNVVVRVVVGGHTRGYVVDCVYDVLFCPLWWQMYVSKCVVSVVVVDVYCHDSARDKDVVVDLVVVV